jgi:DNA-binding winged helix-turn-helix (wHTH) protein/Tfp pilus assembly protein PilF
VLKRGDKLVALPPKAIQTLAVLLGRAGEVIDKETMFRLIWPGTFVAESSLTKNISMLRKVLDENASGESVIQTVSKRGYRFTAEVEPAKPAEVAPKLQAQESWSHWLFALVAIIFLSAIILTWRFNSSAAAPSRAGREYLIGRHMWSKLDRQDMQKALEHFQKALELAPKSALAHAGLADTYVTMTTLGMGRAEENLSRARTAARRALALDQTLAHAHVSLGHVRVLADFDWKGGENEFRQAIALEPRLAAAHYGYACLLVHSGRIEEARMSIRRAEDLDPVSPLISVAAARIEYYGRRYQHAVEMLREVLEREPSFSQAHYYLAMSLGQLGRTEEALRHLREAHVHSSLTAADEAWLLSLRGNRERARLLLAERRDLVSAGRATSAAMLLPAIDSGENDLAISSLEEMVRARRIELVSLRVNPRLDPLRSDPRFTDLVRRIWRDY